MPEEYFDVAYINHNKAVLHGRVRAGRDADGCSVERYVEIVLTDEQKCEIERLNCRHDTIMQNLLRSFAHASEDNRHGE
jgi:hypothetical protein